MSRALVIIPTYNESSNLADIVARIRYRQPAMDILVVDDNSPDRTGDVADKLAADGPVNVLHRPGKDGLGSAYRAGFAWGLERNYEVLIEMDADGSHRPEELGSLLEGIEGGADLVLGSRWVPGGRVVNWPLHRKLISQIGNGYARILLGLELRDSTSGFRAYRRATLDRLDLATVASQGYCFQIDMARRAVAAGCRVIEVPITFVERVRGESKMSRAIVIEALWRVTVWGLAGLSGRARTFVGRLGVRR